MAQDPRLSPRSVAQLCDFDRVRAAIRRYGLDALVCSVPHNVFYLSGFDHPPMWHFPFHAFAIVPASGEPALVLSGLGLAAPAELNLWIQDIYPFGQRETIIYEAQELLEVEAWLLDYKASLADRRSDTPFQAIARALRDRGVDQGRIGFDDPGIAHRVPLDGLSAIDAVDVIREARMIKTPAEIEWMRAAAVANEESTMEAVRIIPFAKTWEHVVQRYRSGMAVRGGEAKYMIGGAPHHTSTFQHQFRDYPLKKGEFYMVDSLGVINHYHGDFGRTLSWGEPDPEVLKRYNAMRKGFEAGFSIARPGLSFDDLGAKVVETARSEGFSQFFAAAPHSVGLEHTDTPRVPGHVLQANMTLNIDIVYMEAGFGALHLEDTFVIRPTGAELLTSGKNEMLVLHSS